MDPIYPVLVFDDAAAFTFNSFSSMTAYFTILELTTILHNRGITEYSVRYDYGKVFLDFKNEHDALVGALIQGNPTVPALS